MAFFASPIALDIGNHVTRVYHTDKQQLFVFPSRLSSDKLTEQEKRAHRYVPVVPFLEKSRLTEEEFAIRFLKDIIKHAHRRSVMFSKPPVIASVPCFFTPVEQEAVAVVIEKAGAGVVQLVSSLFAAAVGSSVDVSSARATLMCSLGSGVSEFGLIMGGAQRLSRELSLTSEAIAQVISRDIRRSQGVDVSTQYLEDVLAMLSDKKRDTSVLRIPGKKLAKGTFVEVELTKSYIDETVMHVAKDTVEQLKRYVHELDASLAADVIDQGILCTGGVSLLPGLASHLAHELRIPVSVVPSPTEAVIDGLRELVSHMYWEDVGLETGKLKVLGCIE